MHGGDITTSATVKEVSDGTGSKDSDDRANSEGIKAANHKSTDRTTYRITPLPDFEGNWMRSIMRTFVVWPKKGWNSSEFGKVNYARSDSDSNSSTGAGADGGKVSLRALVNEHETSPSFQNLKGCDGECEAPVQEETGSHALKPSDDEDDDFDEDPSTAPAVLEHPFIRNRLLTQPHATSVTVSDGHVHYVQSLFNSTGVTVFDSHFAMANR